MSIEHDETLRIYVDESLEHLADIENDFLSIEAAGADIDEELVNKVYRAAHSIKGGAGFMGLTNIKNLTHEMENILGKIRSREMIPDAEVINSLLLSSDALRNLINDIDNSNSIDVSQHIEALAGLVFDSLPEEESLTNVVDIVFPDGNLVLAVAEYDISKARKEGKYIYLLDYDLIRDIDKKDKNPLDVLSEMQQCGSIIESRIDADVVGTLEDKVFFDRLPFMILFASVLQPNDINSLLEIDEKYIFELAENLTLKPIAELASTSSSDYLNNGAETGVKEVETEFRSEEVPSKDEQLSTSFQSTQSDSEIYKKSLSSQGKAGVETSLRVQVSLLDSLMTLAGELVLSRNQLLQSISSGDHSATDGVGQKIDMITSELQEAIMFTRMQPIGNIFNKFPRVVRDLAGSLGKDVELSLGGNEVELDKTIIEAIGDPLTHLVRNAVDHGIETPDNRIAANKEPTGHLLLRAFHEAGQVNIEISDDGKGLDGKKLAATAVAKGLITEDQAAMMTQKEKINLIFLPGFSTAKEVTDVSGRGVGMDVVKTNLDKLGGVIDIDSEQGEGTAIRIKLPLTLAIIPSQIILTEGERYAIPQVNLEELLRIPADRVKERIERVGDAEVVRLRGNLLPLMRLADVIGVERSYADPFDQSVKIDRRKSISDRRSKHSVLVAQGLDCAGKGIETETHGAVEKGTTDSQTAIHKPRGPQDRRYHAASAVNIVVVSTGSLKYGLVVDQLYDSEEIVVKPLGRHLKNCKGYAGATIMGDGRVALILDVAGLSRMAELTSVEGSTRAADIKKEVVKSKEGVQSLLIFMNADDEQFAVPLSQVSRIEKIKRSNIEQIGGKRVMQYRGESLPLIAIDEVTDVKPMAEKDDLLVIVFMVAMREIGLLAAFPVDALEVSVKLDESTLKQTGIMGSAIIGDRTTLMVDIFKLVESAHPEWFAEQETVHVPDSKAATILYAEDSKFFRNQVKDFIEEQGYNVIEAEDGMVAWNLLGEHADKISLVVTDMEMPNLDGYSLTEKIRGDDRFSHLPVIGLTTLAGEEDIKKGKKVGIDRYQIKLDKQEMLECINDLLKGA